MGSHPDQKAEAAPGAPRESGVPGSSHVETGAPPPGSPAILFRKKRKKEKSYRLPRGEALPFRQKAIWGTAVVAAAAAIAGLWGSKLGNLSLDSPLLIVIVFEAAAGAGLGIGLKVLRQEWESYELIVGKKTLIRKVTQRPDVLIRRSEILRVEEWPGMGLRVLTLNRDKVIHIPVELHRYNEVKAQLSDWRVLEERKGRHPYERWPFETAVAGTVAEVVALIVVLRAEERAVILCVGSLLLVGLGWGEYAIQRNPHLDRRIKWLAWVALIGLVPIAGKVIQALRH
jgi:hypothetical protein